MSGSGILKNKTYLPNTKRDSKDVQKQYTVFEFNQKFIKSFESIPITDNDKLNYKTLQSKKKEIKPESLDELYSDVYFYKNNVVVNVSADDGDPPKNTDSLLNKFKYNYIIPSKYHNLVFHDNKSASITSYIQNLHYVYECELELQLNNLKYLGIVGGYLVIYGASIMKGKSLLNLIIKMVNLDFEQKKMVLDGLLVSAEWINSATLIMGSGLITKKINSLRAQIQNAKTQEELDKILMIDTLNLTTIESKTEESKTEESKTEESKTEESNILATIFSLLSSYNEYFMYIPILSHEMNYLNMSADMRSSKRFRDMVSNILYNKSPYITLINQAKKYSLNIFKFTINNSNAEYFINMIHKILENPYTQHNFNNFITNCLTSKLFPEAILKQKFDDDDENDPLNKFNIIQLRKDGLTEKEINDKFLEIIDEKATGKVKTPEYNYNPDELTKLIKTGVPLFFSVEFFNVIYENPYLKFNSDKENPTENSYVKVKKLIDVIFGFMRSFIPDYKIKSYIYNNFILTWKNALIVSYHKVKKFIVKINQIAKDNIPLYKMLTEWLDKELVYNFSISSIVSSFTDFFFTQSITNTYSGISRLLFMSNIMSTQFLEDVFIKNLNVLKTSFNWENCGKSINLLFNDKLSFYWSMFSGTIPETIFQKYNILHEQIFIQKDEDLLGQTVFLKDTDSGKLTNSFSISMLGNLGKENYKNSLCNTSEDGCDKHRKLVDETFMILKNNQETLYIKLEDLFREPYFSKGKFNFYITKQLEVQGFISTNYNKDKYFLEQNINSIIFNQLDLQDNSLYSFLRPNKKMSCYITLSNIVTKLESSETNEKECLKELDIDTLQPQKQIEYLKKIINDKNYTDLLAQIAKFKIKHVAYLSDLNSVINDGFIPFAKDIVDKQKDLSKNQNNEYDYFRIENYIERLEMSYEPFSDPKQKTINNNFYDLLLKKNDFFDENLSINQIINLIKSEYINQSDKIENKKQKIKKYFESILKINNLKTFFGENLKQSIQAFIRNLTDMNLTDINANIIELTSRIDLAFSTKKTGLIDSISQTDCFSFLDYYNKYNFSSEDKKYMEQTFKIPISAHTTDEDIKKNLYELIECSMTFSSSCNLTTFDIHKNVSKTEIVMPKLIKSDTDQNDAQNLFNFFNRISELPDNMDDLFKNICIDPKRKMDFINFINIAIKNYDNYDKDMCNTLIKDLYPIECKEESTLTVSNIKGNKCEEYISVKPKHNVSFKTYLHSFFDKHYILYIRNKINLNDNEKNGEEYNKILTILNYMSIFSYYSPDEIYKLSKQIHDNLNKKKEIVDNKFEQDSIKMLQSVEKLYESTLYKDEFTKFLDNPVVKKYLYNIFDKLLLLQLNSDDDNNIDELLYNRINEQLHKLIGVPKYKLNFLNQSEKYGNNLKEKLVNAIKELCKNFKLTKDYKDNIVVIKKKIDGKILDGFYELSVLKSFLQIQNVIFGKIPDKIRNKFIDSLDENVNNIFSSIKINDVNELTELYENLNIIISKESDLKIDVSYIYSNLSNQVNKFNEVIQKIIEQDKQTFKFSDGISSNIPEVKSKSTQITGIYESHHQTIETSDQSIGNRNENQQETQKLGETQEQKLGLSQEQKLGVSLNQKLGQRQQQKQENRSFEKNIERLKNIWAPAELVRISDQGDYGVIDDSSNVDEIQTFPEHESKNDIKNKQTEQVDDTAFHLIDCDKVTFNHFKGKWYSINDSENELEKQELYFIKCYQNHLVLSTPIKYFIDLIKFLQSSTHRSAMIFLTESIAVGGIWAVGGGVGWVAAGSVMGATTAFVASITSFSALFIGYINDYNQKISALNKSFEEKNSGSDVKLPELGDKPLKVNQLHDYAWIQFFCRIKLFQHIDYFIQTVNSVCKLLRCDSQIDKSWTEVFSEKKNLDNICDSHLSGIKPEHFEVKDNGMDYTAFIKDIFNKDLIINLLKLLKEIFSVGDKCRDSFQLICNKIEDLTKASDIGFSELRQVNELLLDEVLSQNVFINEELTIKTGTKITDDIIKKLKEYNITQVSIKSKEKSDNFIEGIKELINLIKDKITKSFQITVSWHTITNIKDNIGVFISFFRSFFDKMDEWDAIFKLSDKNGIRAQFFGKPNLSPIAKAYDLYVQNEKREQKNEEELIHVPFEKSDTDKNLLIDETNDNKSFSLFQQFLLKINDIDTNVVDMREKKKLEKIINNINKYYSKISIDKDVVCSSEKKNELLNELLNEEKIIYIDTQKVITDQQKQIIKCYIEIRNDTEKKIESLNNSKSNINIDEIIKDFDMSTLSITKNKEFQEYFIKEFKILCQSSDIKGVKYTSKIETIEHFLQSIGIQNYKACKYNTISLNILSKVFITQYPKKIDGTYDKFSTQQNNEFLKSLHIFYHKNIKKLGYLNSIVSQDDENQLKIGENIKIEIPHPFLMPNDPNSSFLILNILHNYDKLPVELQNIMKAKTNLIERYFNAAKIIYNNFWIKRTVYSVLNWNTCKEVNDEKIKEDKLKQANIYLKCISGLYDYDNLFELQEFNVDLHKNINNNERTKIFDKLEIQHAFNFFFHKELYENNLEGQKEIIEANKYLNIYLNPNYSKRTLIENSKTYAIDKNIFTTLFPLNMREEHFIPQNHPYYKFINNVEYIENTRLYNINVILSQHQRFFDYYHNISLYKQIKNWFNNWSEPEFKERFNNYFKAKFKENIKQIINDYKAEDFIINDNKCSSKQLTQYENIKEKIFNNIVNDQTQPEDYSIWLGMRLLLLNITEAKNDSYVDYNVENITILLNEMNITCEEFNQKFINNKNSDSNEINKKITKFNLFSYIENRIKELSSSKINNIIFNDKNEIIFEHTQKKLPKIFIDKFKFYYNFGNFIPNKSNNIGELTDTFYTQNSENLKNILKESLNKKIKTDLIAKINKCYLEKEFKDPIDDILNNIIPKNIVEKELTLKQVTYLYSHHKLIEIINNVCPETINLAKDAQQIYEAFKMELMTSFFINNIDSLKDDFINYLNNNHKIEDIKKCLFFQRKHDDILQQDIEIQNLFEYPKINFKELLIKQNELSVENRNNFLEHINLFLCLKKDKYGNSYNNIIINKFFNYEDIPKFNEKEVKNWFNPSNMKSIINKVFDLTNTEALTIYDNIEKILNNLEEADIELIKELNGKIDRFYSNKKFKDNIEKSSESTKSVDENDNDDNVNTCLNDILKEEILEDITFTNIVITVDNKDKSHEKIRETIDKDFITQLYGYDKKMMSYYQQLLNYNDILSCFSNDTDAIEDKDLNVVNISNFKTIQKSKLKGYFIKHRNDLLKKIEDNKHNLNTFIQKFKNDVTKQLSKQFSLVKYELESLKDRKNYFTYDKNIADRRHDETGDWWPETKKRPWFNSKLSQMIKSFMPQDIRMNDLLHSFFYMFNGNFYKFISYLEYYVCDSKTGIPILCSLKDKNIITFNDLKDKEYTFDTIKYKVISYDKTKKKFRLQDIDNNIIDKEFKYLSQDVYSEDLLDELERNKQNLKINTENTQYISDKKINKISNLFGENNIIYNNEGPYKIKGDISCNKDITIVDPRGNEITVNLFKLIDENFGNVLAEYVDNYRLTNKLRKSDFISSSVESVIKSIDYSKFSINKDCNLSFEYYSPGSLFFNSKTILIDLKININQIIKESINEKFKNFFKILFDYNWHNWDKNKPELGIDLINLFKTSYNIEQRRNVKINTLLDKTREWLKVPRTQSGGAVYQIPNEWKMIHKNIEKINNEIDNLNDEEFINILNVTQNFKDKVNVEIMLNMLENDII